MNKKDNILTADHWSTLLKATFQAFPTLWWRIVLVNMTATLVVLLGLAMTAGIGILLLGGLDATESVYANFISTANLTIYQWSVLLGLLFLWINWFIVFAITAKITSMLIVKDYAHKRSSNPFKLYFQTSWSFFWRYVGLGFRTFWYVYWPFIVLLIVTPFVFMLAKMAFAQDSMETVTPDNQVIEVQQDRIDTAIPVSLSDTQVTATSDDESMVETKPMPREIDKRLEDQIDVNPEEMNDWDMSQEPYYYGEGEENIPPFVQSFFDNIEAVSVGLAFFFLLFIFITWRSVHVAFASFHLIEHDQTAKEAFDTSLKLVKGNWWSVFLSLIAFFLVVAFLPGMAFGAISIIFVTMGIPTWTTDILSNLYSWVVVAPAGVTFVYFLMLHLMKQKKIR